MDSTIAQLRKAKGMTQRQLAAAVGVTETTVRNWERDPSTFAKFAKLCEVLGASPRAIVPKPKRKTKNNLRKTIDS